MIIAAIDPGVANFAVSVENVDDAALGADADTVARSAETVHFQNTVLDARRLTKSVTAALDALDWVWRACDVVLVEHQVQYRGAVNTRPLRVAHHCLSYFELRYPGVTVLDYPAARKTQVLGAPRGLAKHKRKKWAVDYAHAVLADRGDTAAVAARAAATTKLDDVSDCMLMCLAYAVEHASR
jgi:hypothetical protein